MATLHRSGTADGEPVQAHRPDAAASPTAAMASRRARLRLAVAARGVPLPTILVTVGVVVVTYLLGRLAYQLRGILLLIVIASFLALVLNPFVVTLQQWRLPKRGRAVAVVVLLGAVVFLGLSAAFGYPLATGLSHFARDAPSYVSAAEQGHGPVGKLVQHFHLQHWVTDNAPKLQQLGASLAKPALTVGKAAVLLVGQLLAVFTMVVLFLLEGPRLRAGVLALLSPEQGKWCVHVATEVRKSVVGYVFGDLLTSVIAGVIVGVTMWILGLPFPVLWGAWVALVDFLPQVGGALAGIPTIAFAATQSLTDGVVLAIVFVAYQQLENHVLNPIIMSKTVRTSPLLIFMSVLVGGSIGSWIGGAFGAFVGALTAVPIAASVQIVVRELWRATAVEELEDAPEPVRAPSSPAG